MRLVRSVIRGHLRCVRVECWYQVTHRVGDRIDDRPYTHLIDTCMMHAGRGLANSETVRCMACSVPQLFAGLNGVPSLVGSDVGMCSTYSQDVRSRRVTESEESPRATAHQQSMKMVGGGRAGARRSQARCRLPAACYRLFSQEKDERWHIPRFTSFSI